jgi:hypothetical protein
MPRPIAVRRIDARNPFEVGEAAAAVETPTCADSWKTPWVSVPEAIDIAAKFGGFSEHWRPKIAARLNGRDVRLVKTRGVFPWHGPHAEEMFLCFAGVRV